VDYSCLEGVNFRGGLILKKSIVRWLPPGDSNSGKSVLAQIDPAGAIKAHTFCLEPRSLFVIAGRRTKTNFPTRVYDAMPGHSIRAYAHRPTHSTRTSRRAKCARNLPVRDDSPARNLPYERVGAGKESERPG